jgi:hypothetical protein
MIKYILFAVAFLPMTLTAQNTVAPKLGFSEIVDVKSATAKTLMDRANTFMQVKKIEPKIAGTIISGTGSFTMSYPSVKKGFESGMVKFGIKIMVKDGKYKVDLTNFVHEGIQGRSSGGSIDLEKPECTYTQITSEAWAKIKEQTQEQLKAFVQELKTKMDNPVKVAPPSSDF